MKTQTKAEKIANEFDITENTTRCDISYRGGVLEVDVSSLFDVDDAVIGASQNYLGGGIAGAINGGAMFSPEDLTTEEQEVFHILIERIKKHFYTLNEGGGDEYMHENVTGPDAGGYEKNQQIPAAYPGL